MNRRKPIKGGNSGRVMMIFQELDQTILAQTNNSFSIDAIYRLDAGKASE